MLSGWWADSTLSPFTWDGASSGPTRRGPEKDGGNREPRAEWGAPCGSAIFQDLCHRICFLFLHREAPRICPWCRVYMPEAPLLYLESTMSHKPSRNTSILQSQKKERAPVPLCISLLAGGVMRPKSRVGEAQAAPGWRLLWAERAGSGPLSPRHPFPSL